MVREEPRPKDDREGKGIAPSTATALPITTLAEANRTWPAQPASSVQKGKTVAGSTKEALEEVVTPHLFRVLPGVYKAANLEEM